MSKLQQRRLKLHKTPEMQISPMIDMMFLLLVFFIMGTMYMTQVKTIAVKTPNAENSVTQAKVNVVVSIKADGSLFLNDKQVDIPALKQKVGENVKTNTDLPVIIRADKAVDYGRVINVLDQLKGVGVTRFGMATSAGETDEKN